MAWWFALAACCCLPFGPDAEPEAPAPERPEVETGYVLASSLRLRPKPGDASSLGALAINTRLRLGEQREGWVAVTTPDGRAGWVSTDFVDPAPLTMDRIREEIEAAATDDGKLTWWERAAAMRPRDPDVLDGLIAAYRAVGRGSDADKVARNRQEASAVGLAAMFPRHHEALSEIGPALEGARTVEALFAVWAKARALVLELDEALQARAGDAQALPEGDDQVLRAEVAWASLEWYAEGTSPALELDSARFVAAAERTDGDLDDRFFALVTTAYPNATGRGWAEWQVRSWDYGGCSPFGASDLHLDLLAKSDALAGEAVPALATEIRADVIGDITHDSELFAYCTNEVETPTAALVDAARQILDRIRLAPDERAAVERRIETRFGRGG
jgi:hypothetical protein